MKSIIIITLSLAFISYSGFAQRLVEKSVKISKIQDVSLDFQFADEINITGWDKPEVMVKVSVNINDNQDNDAFYLNIEEKDGLKIESEIMDMDDLHNEYILEYNDEGKVIRRSSCIDMDLLFEVFIPYNAAITLETISGDILLENLKGSMDIKTISGFIDLSVYENEGIDFDLRTITGGMYSDLDLDFDEEDAEDLIHIGGNNIDACYNGGGKLIALKSISGDIYLRKAK